MTGSINSFHELALSIYFFVHISYPLNVSVFATTCYNVNYLRVTPLIAVRNLSLMDFELEL